MVEVGLRAPTMSLRALIDLYAHFEINLQNSVWSLAGGSQSLQEAMENPLRGHLADACQTGPGVQIHL